MSSNFCINCGARMARKGWRARIRGARCDDCATRLGGGARSRAIVGIILIAVVAFAFGRYLRPAPPPLIIHRAANSPLSDASVNLDPTTNGTANNSNRRIASATVAADDIVYICGARTKKGTPCKRRVHFAGERCYQHKGMPAMVPLEKLTIKPDMAKK